MESPRQNSYVISFHDVCYEVMVKHGKKSGTAKHILKHLSGSCSSGRLTAVMGPSGAGKTSLLDILAGMKVNGKCSGDVMLNGVPRKESNFSKITSYVQQKDVLVPSATVREALVTSALLKLPFTWSKAQKLQRVDSLLSQLELSHVADSFIGEETLGIKGISGGEKRRVSVGIELVKDPAIIFLDEPTTGLDSEMALGVMTALKAMTKAGKMVIATIHQPNSAICDCFDDWMLLSRGRLLYSGPWSNAVPHFQQLGYSCPLYKNPADHFMTLASGADIAEQLAEAFIAQERKLTSTASMAQQQQQQQQGDEIVVDMQPSPATPVSGMVTTSPSSSSPGCCSSLRVSTNSSSSSSSPPVWYQVYVLMLRFFRTWWRTPIMITAEMGQYIILGLFVGLLYLRQPPLLPDGPYDRMSAVFLTLTLLCFTPSYTALVVWDYERTLLRREAGTNTYKRGSFFAAKSLVTAPIEAAEVTVFAVLLYFMFGFQATAAKFLIWWVTLVLFALASETIGMLCAIITPDSKIGVTVLSALLVFLLSFSGFLVRNVPVYFVWVTKISYFSLATDILVTNEFEGLTFSSADGSMAVPGLSLIPAATKTGLSVAGNMVTLLGITLGARLACWLLLELAAARKFL